MTRSNMLIVNETLRANTPLGDDPKVVKLAPMGRVESKSGHFILDAQAVADITRAMSAHGVEVPFDYEHQTMGGDWESPDGTAPASGWIKSVEVRDGWLVGRVEWTQRALEMIKAKEYRYVSPVFEVTKETRRVVALHSAALTNKPAIPRMEALAAKAKHERSTSMNGETGMVDPSAAIGRIAEALGITEANDPGAMLEAILAKVRDLKTPAEKKEEPKEESANKADLTRIASSLGIGGGEVTVDLIVAKAASLTRQTTETAAMTAKISKLETDAAERDLTDRLRPYITCGALAETDADYQAIVNAARRNWDETKLILDVRKKHTAPMQGWTKPPSGATGGAAKEDELIANAVKEHKGDYGRALSELQIKLKQPYLDRGLTNKAANEACRQAYPIVFAA